MVAIPGVKFVAKMAGKIPGYKGLAKIGVKNTARKTVRAASRGVGAIANGVGAIRNGAVAAGKTSRNVVRKTQKGFNRVRRFFGMKSRKQRSRKSKPRSVRRSARRSVRRNTRKSINRMVPRLGEELPLNRAVQFAPNVRNKANAKPVVRELTPMPVVAAPVAAKAFPAKAFNSPIGVAVANMSAPPKAY